MASPSKTLRWAAFALLVAVPGALGAQGPLVVAHLSVRLADLSVAADTVAGLQVIVQPGVVTKQGKTEKGLVWLRFHPDSALDWINSAAAAIRVPLPNGPAEGIQWSRTLLPENGKGAMAMGRNRKKGNLQGTHWLAVADSGTGWRIELTAQEADSLLKLLLALGSQSRLDTARTGAFEAEKVDRPVTIEHQPTPRYRGILGRVVAEFVVGTDGRVEPASFVAYIASDPKLVDEAREVVRQSRFRPAERGGQAVRQLVRQAINWMPGPP